MISFYFVHVSSFGGGGGGGCLKHIRDTKDLLLAVACFQQFKEIKHTDLRFDQLKFRARLMLSFYIISCSQMKSSSKMYQV